MPCAHFRTTKKNLEMYGRDQREAAEGYAVDLSFSQVLEARSSFQQQQQQQRRRKQPLLGNTRSAAPLPPPAHSFRSTSNISASLFSLDSVYESSEERDDDVASSTSSLGGGELSTGSSTASMQRRRKAPDSTGSDTGEESDWATGDDGQLGQDVYRFVQPRRLSSWVQDDAVFACFKCHQVFSLLVRKHHCRACGRIFCSSCSSQRVVIPVDYESTPVSPSYNSLTTNASDLIGNISWYFVSYASPSAQSQQIHHAGAASHFMEASQRLSPEEQQERFLKDVQRLQQSNVIGKFTPCRNRAGSTSIGMPSTQALRSSHIPEGSVQQRVCDDCACALQQRRHHYNTVKVFELCEFNLQELRTLGQVCRKWHRASIMCLSTFRQIQYYLPSHRLSEREKSLLIINRKFLSGHTKWMLQLAKAINFTQENEDDPPTEEGQQQQKQSGKINDAAMAKEVLALMQQERKHKCMLTMCSRLCQREIGSVDALEVLSDDSIRNTRLRALCVDALLRTATENEWWSFLPVLLHSLSVESNVAESKLGQALFRQAQCDVRFCYDFYWGLTVLAEDAGCRRKFDGIRQRLLLTLAQFKNNTSCGHLTDPRKQVNDDITEQLLRGQEFVDLMWKVPARIPVDEVRVLFQRNIEKAGIFGLSVNGKTSRKLLRLPVDPSVKVSGIEYKSIEVKRSAEAPIILTCTGVERDEDENESSSPDSGSGEHSSPPRSRRNDRNKLSQYRMMYKRDDLRKDAIVQNIINVMYLILKQETRLDIPLVTYRVLPTSSFDGLIEIVENAHTLYSIIRDHGNIMNFLHQYNSHRTLGEISSSFRDSLAAYTVITFLLGVGDRHADNVMLTRDGILFHIDYGFILGKDPKPLQPPMRIDHYMIDALGGTQTAQYEQFKKLCVVAFNCLRRHVSLFMIMLTLVVKATPEITDFGLNYTQSDLEAFVIERFLPGQSDDEAATALMLRMEGKLNEKIGLKLSDFVHAHANEKTVSKGMVHVGSSVKIGVEAVEATVSTVASSITSGASSIYNYMWGATS